MNFRLIYEGPLKASGNKQNRISEKHVIRKQFHKQMLELWANHPSLEHFRYVRGSAFPEDMWHHQTEEPYPTYLEALSKEFSRCGFNFVPLVHKALHLMCELDILFLRRDNPGDLVLPGGDVDNRIKTLLDGLKVPKGLADLGSAAVPDENENPFFCLVEDDSLITALNITTDRLLRPPVAEEHENEVVLIIGVKVRAARVTMDNLELISV